MQKFLMLILLLANFICLLAFEGNVQLTRQSQYDTTYLVFYIKESKVRIDEFSNNGQLIKTFLVDINTENIVALNPDLKLYIEIPKKEQPPTDHKIDVIKTKNYKVIDGNICYQWRVRNRILDSEITYWVMESKIDVVQKLYRILNSTENYSSILSFYMHIPESSGFVPLVAVERNLVREEKQSMHITSINEGKVSAKLFKIPSNYKSVKI